MRSCKGPVITAFLLGACVGLAAQESASANNSPGRSTAPRRPQSLVELKVMLKPHQLGRIQQLLNLGQARHKKQRIYFFDTNRQDLLNGGTVLRVRRTKLARGHKSKTTAKLRPLEADRVDLRWFGVKGFKNELDRVDTRQVSTTSLSAKRNDRTTSRVLKGKKKLKKLFTKKQRKLLKAYSGVDFNFKKLRTHGPIKAEVWEIDSPVFGTEVCVQTWKFGRGARSNQFLEMSMRTTQQQADALQRTLSRWLSDNGIVRSTSQKTKTRMALEYFGSLR